MERPNDLDLGKRTARDVSVDVLRGLVMVVMVFVNDVAGVEGAPGWMQHFDGRDGMTFVDVVFPAFLFVVGVSVPFAIESRRRKGEGWATIWLHIILRTVSLLLLGVLMVNSPSAREIGWRGGLWQLLFYTAAVLAFVTPPRDRWGRWWWPSVAVRVIGFGGLACLAWVYRGRDGEWLRTSWWGILGLIGWAYLVACLAYVPLRRHGWALVLVVPALLSMYYLERQGWLDWAYVGRYVSLGSALGSQGSIAVAGAALGWLLMPTSPVQNRAARIGIAVVFGAVLATGAIAVNEPYGINKNMATPAWCLWSSAITCWLWAAVAGLTDLLGWRRWGWLLAVAGANALLIYLLHPLLQSIFWAGGIGFYGGLGDAFWPGLARATAVALTLPLVAWALNRAGVRLRL